MGLVSSSARRRTRQIQKVLHYRQEISFQPADINSSLPAENRLPLGLVGGGKAADAAVMLSIALNNRRQPSWKPIKVGKIRSIVRCWFYDQCVGDQEAHRRMFENRFPNDQDLQIGLAFLEKLGYIRTDMLRRKVIPTKKLQNASELYGTSPYYSVPRGVYYGQTSVASEL